LGGIGPEATAEFYFKLIKGLQRNGLIKENKDFPQIIINSINAPELIGDKINNGDLESYIFGLKELDSLNLDFIVMVCNTIHLYYDLLQSKIETPIVDLRLLVNNKVVNSGIKSLFVLGTKSVVHKRLYDTKNVRLFEPDENEVSDIEGALFNFNRGFEKEKQVGIVRRICEKYIAFGAESVLLGCTEIAVMLQNESFSKINTIDCLVDFIIFLDKFLNDLRGEGR